MGRTVIKGGWGRFAHNWHSDELQMANENVHLVTRFLWHDLNNNLLYDPGEINFNLGPPDFQSTSLFTGSEDGLAGAVSNPNITEPMSNEFSTSIEHQLIPGLAIRATGIYSRQQVFRVQNNLRPYSSYNIPITRPDPGPDGVLATADDPGKSITFYEYPTSLAGRQFQQPMLGQRHARRRPDLQDVRARREQAARSPVDGDGVVLHHVDQRAALAEHSERGQRLHHAWTAGISGDARSQRRDQQCLQHPRIDGEARGGVDLSVVGAALGNFEHRSGAPWARTVNFAAPAGQPIANLVLRVEPIGAQRLPDINLLHMRVEKQVKLSGSRKLALRVNVFNATNINTEQSITQLSGVNFARPGNILSPRIVELGAEYSF
jgi:hypothetical protein